MSRSHSLSYDAWTDALREGELLGAACADCNEAFGTPVSVCHECGSRDLESIELPTDGELYSVTRINVPPVGFEGPYYIGIVELDGVRLMARIRNDSDSDGTTNESEPTIGTTVALSGVIEEDKEGLPAPVFSVTEVESEQ